MERSGSHRISFSSPTRLTGCVVVAWLALALGPLPFEAAEVPTIAKDVEEAALAEAWAKLADTLLGSVSQRSPDAVLRLIKAHACLAVNRNNESLELFASALSDADRRAWERWADAFAAAHPNSAIAWYFWGDALARQKRWRSNEKDPQKAKESPGADECFAEAIRLDPSCYLALNARGVAAHAVGSTLLARVYFLKATKAKEDFADAATVGADATAARSAARREAHA